MVSITVCANPGAAEFVEGAVLDANCFPEVRFLRTVTFIGVVAVIDIFSAGIFHLNGHKEVLRGLYSSAHDFAKSCCACWVYFRCEAQFISDPGFCFLDPEYVQSIAGTAEVVILSHFEEISGELSRIQAEE
jgi:hypothetical protein